MSAAVRKGRMPSTDDDQREEEIARLIETVGRPIAEKVVRRYVRSESAVTAEDAEDIMATAMMRLVARLRATGGAEEAIEHFPDYAAALTFNAVNDYFRRKYPHRTRLKNRLRYALTHDARLALWAIEEQLAGGLAAWRGSMRARVQPMDVPAAIRAGADRDRPAETLVALFRHAGEPFLLSALIDTLSPLWPATEAPPAASAAGQQSAHAQLEWREILALLWREIRELRPMQRKALLLNLRDAGRSSVLGLLVETGTAAMEDIAEALAMPPAGLAAIWSELPLDDLRIAAMLGLSRQQVISLRKSARERLTRRMSHLRRP
jgi:RNA polymerase sigma factor (sigma-70 family)